MSRPRPSIMPPSSRASLAPSAAGGGSQQQQQTSRALAEELEKTEQSITLALQEIDKNFSKANKIVGESVLPVIEKYSNQSKNMWSGAAFWKQFLEAAANVSLSGYEENINDEDTENAAGDTNQEEDYYESMTTPVKQSGVDDADDDDVFTSTYKEEDDKEGNNLFDGKNSYPDLGVQSTPRIRDSSSSPTKIPRPSSRSSRSTPRRESQKGEGEEDDEENDGKEKQPNDISMDDLDKDLPPPRLSLAMDNSNNRKIDDDNDSSTFIKKEENYEQEDTTTATPPRKHQQQHTGRTPKSILRHQVLDKNWRIQATPYKKQDSAVKSNSNNNNEFGQFDSPEIQPPKLTSHIFDSPQDISMGSPQAAATPVRGGNATNSTHNEAGAFNSNNNTYQTPNRSTNNNGGAYYNDSDSDTDMLPDGMSPPVTMHFKTHLQPGNHNNHNTNHQNTNNPDITRTPARQAAQAMVDDILRDVGGDDESQSFASSIGQQYTRYKTDWSDDDL